MSGLTSILLVWDLSCERCGQPCALRVPTVKGAFCFDCYFGSGEPPSPPPTEEARERVELQWAQVKTGKSERRPA